MNGREWPFYATILAIVFVMVVTTPSIAGTNLRTVLASPSPAGSTSTTLSSVPPLDWDGAIVPHLSIAGLPIGVAHPLDRSKFGVLQVAEDRGLVHLPLFSSAVLPYRAPLAAAWPLASQPLGYSNGSSGWYGMDDSSPNPCGCTPPDTSGSAGNGYVFETVNAAFGIWTTTGTVVSTGALTTLFNTSDSISDPNIHFDPVSQRWVAEIISVTNYGDVFLAVSTNSQPLVWHNYLLHMPNHTGTSGDLPDQVNVGVAANTISLSGNDFPGGGSFGGAVTFVVNKSQALSGATPSYVIAGPWSAYASVHAGEVLSPSGKIYFLSSNFQSSTKLNEVTLSGSPPSGYHFAFHNFSTSSTVPGTPTFSGGYSVATNDNRIGSAVWRAGDMWAAANDGVCSGSVASCIHLWQVNTTTTTVAQDFIWTPGTSDGYYPAVTLDTSGNMGLLYSTSTSSTYPSLAISGQATTDGAGTVEAPTIVKSGTGPGAEAETGQCLRFGDYSGAATDLSTGTMWGFGEWMLGAAQTACPPSGAFTWATWVQSFSFGGGGALSVSTPSANRSSADTGQQVTFSATASGGSGGYVYAWSTTPATGLGCGASTTGSVTCVPTAKGNYTVTVKVTDSSLGTASATSPNFQTFSPPGTAVPSGSSSSDDVGVSVTYSTAGWGGSGGLTYSWSSTPASGLGCTASTSSSESCSPTASSSYAVTATVLDSNGGWSTATLTSYTVYPDPTVSVPSASAVSGAVGKPVWFNATAGLAGSGSDTYAWTASAVGLGCGTSTTLSEMCTPTSSGSYTTTVTATDSNGGTGSNTSTSFTVASVNPVVTTPTGSPLSVDVGQSVTFSTTASGGSGGYTFAWTASSSGLGCPSSASSSLTCDPTSAGTTYTVTVTATDSSSHTSAPATSSSFTVYADPSVSVPSPNRASADVTQSVTFTSTLTSAGSGGDSYAWSTSPSSGPGCGSPNSVSVSCTPTVAGSFVVTLAVTDSNTKTVSTASASYVVSAAPALTPPTPSPSNPQVYQSVIFTETPTSTGSGVGGYAWSASSASLGCTSSTTTTYTCTPTIAGTYTASVTLTDTNGMAASSISGSLTVSPTSGPLTCTATASPTSGAAPLRVSFTASCSGGTPAYTYAWTFGDGNSGTGASPQHTFTTAGTFHPSVAVTDTASGSTTASTSAVTVQSTGQGTLTASPSASPSPATAGQLVTFTAGASGGTAPYVYSWSFGDGVTGTGASPTHTYAASGTFTVALTVDDNAGHTFSTSISLVVNSAGSPNSTGPGFFGSMVGPMPLWVLLVLFVLLAVAVVAAIASGRRRRAPPAGGSSPEGSWEAAYAPTPMMAGGGAGPGVAPGAPPPGYGAPPPVAVPRPASPITLPSDAPVATTPTPWTAAAPPPAPAPSPPPARKAPPPDRPIDEVAPDPFGGRR